MFFNVPLFSEIKSYDLIDSDSWKKPHQMYRRSLGYSFHWQLTVLAPDSTFLRHTACTDWHWPGLTRGCRFLQGKAGDLPLSGRDSRSPEDTDRHGLCWHSSDPRDSRSRRRHQCGWCRCRLDRTDVEGTQRGSRTLLDRCFLWYRQWERRNWPLPCSRNLGCSLLRRQTNQYCYRIFLDHRPSRQSRWCFGCWGCMCRLDRLLVGSSSLGSSDRLDTHLHRIYPQGWPPLTH